MSELALVAERSVSDRNEEQLVTMTVEGQLFGLPILSVQDIVETHKITQVPRTPSAISGIMNLRGRIVTVINLRRILGRSDDTNSKMGVTVEFHGDLYTILVDQIGEVCLLDRSDFEAAPATLDPKLKQLCTGIYRLDGELLAVLDVNQILSAETIAQTPPIQFFAKRQKENTESKGPSVKALPAPANDEPEDEAPEPEEAAKRVAPKPGKNLFRKPKSAAKPKQVADKVDVADSDSGSAPAKKTQKPAIEVAEKAAAPEAPPKETAKVSKAPEPVAAAPEKQPAAAVPETDKEPAPKPQNATDVAPGKPTQRALDDDLLAALGGEVVLGKAAAAFIEKIAGDAKLAEHFDGVDTAKQARAMQSFFAKALGRASSGATVPSPGHQWLSPNKGLNDDDFNSCLNHFEAVLKDLKVPDGTIFRVLAVFEQYRESIVD